MHTLPIKKTALMNNARHISILLSFFTLTASCHILGTSSLRDISKKSTQSVTWHPEVQGSGEEIAALANTKTNGEQPPSTADMHTPTIRHTSTQKRSTKPDVAPRQSYPRPRITYNSQRSENNRRLQSNDTADDDEDWWFMIKGVGIIGGIFLVRHCLTSYSTATH